MKITVADKQKQRLFDLAKKAEAIAKQIAPNDNYVTICIIGGHIMINNSPKSEKYFSFGMFPDGKVHEQ